MALTTEDLQKIRGVVREEVEAEIGNTKNDLGRDIMSLKIHMFDEFDKIKDRLKNLEIGVKNIQKGLKYSTNFLDKQDIRTEKRLLQVEKKLGLQPTV